MALEMKQSYKIQEILFKILIGFLQCLHFEKSDFNVGLVSINISHVILPR